MPGRTRFFPFLLFFLGHLALGAPSQELLNDQVLKRTKAFQKTLKEILADKDKLMADAGAFSKEYQPKLKLMAERCRTRQEIQNGRPHDREKAKADFDAKEKVATEAGTAFFSALVVTLDDKPLDIKKDDIQSCRASPIVKARQKNIADVNSEIDKAGFGEVAMSGLREMGENTQILKYPISDWFRTNFPSVVSNIAVGLSQCRGNFDPINTPLNAEAKMRSITNRYFRLEKNLNKLEKQMNAVAAAYQKATRNCPSTSPAASASASVGAATALPLPSVQ